MLLLAAFSSTQLLAACSGAAGSRSVAKRVAQVEASDPSVASAASLSSVKNDNVADSLADVCYTTKDSLKIASLLREAAQMERKPDSWMLWFGKKFCDVPYVGGTLDRDKVERLVVNTTEQDCTTYVEMVLALSMCADQGETSFARYCEHLRHVRYVGGEVAYVKRQHYFTLWIADNEREGIVTDIHPNPPFTATQQVMVNWMSAHQVSYKMLSAHPEWLSGIKSLEQSINGLRCRYIPKANIADNKLFRETIKDGDIIVIVTNKKGLDTTHIGLASWHRDGLHLLNASSIHKKVIDEPMLLRTYMKSHPVQIGIRVCRAILPNEEHDSK